MTKLDRIKKLMEDGFNELDRGFVATPKDRESLDYFSSHNKGVNDALLTQMAINWGYKIAMENIKEILEEQKPLNN